MHLHVLTPPVLEEFHDRRHMDRRSDHSGLHHRLKNRLDLHGAGPFLRVVHINLFSVLQKDLVYDVRSRRENPEAEFTLQSLAHDLQVERAQEPHPEPEPQRRGIGRVKLERGVVQMKFLESLFQHLGRSIFQGVKAGENERFYLPEPRQRLDLGIRLRNRISYLHFGNIPYTGHEITYLPGRKGIPRLGGYPVYSQLQHFVIYVRGNRLHFHSFLNDPVHDPYVDYRALERVVERIKDQGAKRGPGFSGRRRNPLYHSLQEFIDALSGLGRNEHYLVLAYGDDLHDLFPGLLHHRSVQIDFIYNGNDFHIIPERQLAVGQRLGFHPLGSI